MKWYDDDVEYYCIVSRGGCDWKEAPSYTFNGYYSVTTTHTLGLTNCQMTVKAYLKDKAGNISDYEIDYITHDNIKPSIISPEFCS